MPGVNGGMLTTAFVSFTTSNTCHPVPEATESSVTEFAPVVTVNEVKAGSGNKPGSGISESVGIKDREMEMAL